MHTETSKSLGRHLLLTALLCVYFLAFPFRVEAETFVNPLANPAPAECLFNWAEKTYPALLAPAGSPTQFWTIYSYRYYSATRAYLGVNSVNNHVYYLGSDGVLQDVGSLADWTPKAGCPLPPTPPAECLFNWAEHNYPDLFAPIGSPWTVSSIDWTSRYYALTNAYLRIQSTDTHVYYQGSGGLSQDVGPLSDWTPKASCTPPVANAGPDQTATVGETITLDASASSDLDGNLITYQWILTRIPAGSHTGLSNPTALHPTLVIDKPGIYLISLVVNDGQFASVPATVAINTQNSKPLANAGTAQSGKVGDTLVLDGSASQDVDGDTLSHHWTLPVKPQNSNAQLNNPDTISPNLTLDKPGSYKAQLIVNDGKAGSEPATVVLSTVNSKPVAKAGPAQSILLTTPAPSVLLDGNGSSDADSDPLSFSWALISQPAGSKSVLLDPLAPLARFTPDFIGDYVAQLIVNDGHVLSDPNTAQITVTAPPPPQNHPPQITSSPVTTVTVGSSYSYDVDAGDSDNDTLAYSLSVFPSGMTINAQNGLISWTPATGQTGNQSVTVNVIDGKGGSDSQSFNVTVAAAGQILVPDLRNLSRTAAEIAIVNANLTVNTPGFIHNAASPGSVISQTPDAGVRVAAGTAVTLTISLGLNLGLPPDPVIVAPPIDKGVATILANASEFLYTGNNPIQTGVTPGTIETLRAAVVRGNVLDKNNQPLSGVTITVLNHPEFGQTLSRADGLIDMAVNGGGRLIVNYQKTGFLPVQHQINVRWQDFALLPEVVMIPLDAQVTAIDVNAPSAMQVARGGPVTDSDGTRQATVLIPQGTTAQLVLPNGSTQPITTLSVRATEYTVGANGPNAMPGELPPSSGYTYAVELSADEAIAAGATSVRFSQPVPFYVENFVGFPVGSLVPAGFYDSGIGQWVASNNGLVIKVISITGGLANLDLDGNGTIDDATALAALAITDEERQHLASLYSPGQELWRVLIPHFSPLDCNAFWGPPTGSEPPGDSDPKPGPQPDKPPKDPCKKSGSIIGCEPQTLGELINVTGTPFNLHYQSDRVPGRRDTNTLRIRLSGATLPPGLQRIHLEIAIAGRAFRKQFASQPHLFDTFTWDGKDAYGRLVQGKQPAHVRIGYEYIPQYYVLNGAGQVSFNRFGSPPSAIVRGVGGGGGGAPILFSVQPGRTTTSAILWQDHDESLGTLDSPGLGGWSLSNHHTYDVGDPRRYVGNGDQRSASGLDQVIFTVAGKGSGSGFEGDGGPAAQAKLNRPLGVAAGSDGSLYFSDTLNYRVRRVGPDGIITTVAGGGASNVPGDGGPATQAGLSPGGVAVGPDGSLYIADLHRVRRVRPDGIITTVAGTGVSGFAGDGGLATQAQLDSPQGVAVGPDGSLYITEHNHRVRLVGPGPDGIITTVAGTGLQGYEGDGRLATQAKLSFPKGVAVGADGSLYFTDRHRIRRVGPDGIITTVAGSGFAGFMGDGGPATQALLNFPQAVTVGSDGSLYIVDNQRIRRVRPDGIITTVAGTGGGGFAGDGGPATQARLNSPQGVAMGPDGSLYIADSANNRIRQLRSWLPGLSVSDILIASEDGSELFVFTGTGRHLRTLAALTGAVRFQFTYDSADRLVTITDGNGNVTTVERNASGQPTAIIGPYGQRTLLRLDSNGYLASIGNPAGEAVQIAYNADGLLTHFTDPGSNTSQMTYDALGRLIRDENAAGGFMILTRTETTNGFQTALTSAEGRMTTFLVEDLPNGDQHRGTTLPNGAQALGVTETDGSNTTTLPDGTVLTTVEGPDRRFGMQAPVLQSMVVTTPGGLALNRMLSRTATLTDLNNVLSLQTQTDTVNLNGQVYTKTYDASSKTAIRTSAAGRQSQVVIDALGRVMQSRVTGLLDSNLTYDTRGRLVSVTQGASPNDRAFSFGYNAGGYLDTLTDPLGRSLSYAYDAAGRVTRKTLPDGREIDCAYDANGNLTSLTPPGRPGHLFRYTDRDQTAEYAPPPVAGTGSTLYDYDLDKELTKITRPGGQTLDFGYDSAGQLSTLTLPTGRISYAYNATTGKLTSITAPDDGVLAYTYNGALLTRTAWTGTVAGTVDRTYDNNFRVTSLSVNDANAIAFQYDADSLLTQAGNLTLTRGAQNGLLTGTALGDLTDSYSYDGFADVTAYEAKYGAASLLRFEYNRDKLGRIIRKRQIQGGVTHVFDYGYDTAGRLVEVKRDGVVTSSYGYDANGNRTHLNGAEVAHYDDQDRLLDYQGATYQYTANGELRQKTAGSQTTRYDYDVLGNLRKVILPGGTVIDYVIDGQNRRIGKKRNGSLEQGFLYQGQLQPIAELDGNGAIVSRFVYATGINVPDYMVKGGVIYRIVKDHLGSPRRVVDVATNTVAQEMDYDAFGKVTLDTNPGFQPFGFAGGLYDRDTGLVRFGARDYDAHIGRWSAKDLLMFDGMDTNFYRFVLSDPINSIDIDGLSPWAPSAWDSIMGGIGAIAAGGGGLGSLPVYVLISESVPIASFAAGGVIGAGLAGYGVGRATDWALDGLSSFLGLPLTLDRWFCILTACDQPDYEALCSKSN